LAALKQVNDISGNIMEQAAVERYCRTGAFDIHVKRMHREYRKRMKTALAMAKRCIPAKHFKYTIPTGGYTFWVEAKDPNLVENELIERISQAGIHVSPGSQFFTQQKHNACFRISIGHSNQTEINIGMQKLGNALSAFNKT
jgi:DNA-binding transcriptional MocR family regulator